MTTDVAEVTQIISKKRNSVKKSARNVTVNIDLRTKENELTILQYLSNERQTNILQRDIKLKKDFLITFWFKAYTFIDLYTQVYIWNTRKLALTNLNDSTVNGLRFSTSCGEIQYLMVVFHFKLLSNRFSTSIADVVSNFPVNMSSNY